MMKIEKIVCKLTAVILLPFIFSHLVSADVSLFITSTSFGNKASVSVLAPNTVFEDNAVTRMADLTAHAPDKLLTAKKSKRFISQAATILQKGATQAAYIALGLSKSVIHKIAWWYHSALRPFLWGTYRTVAFLFPNSKYALVLLMCLLFIPRLGVAQTNESLDTNQTNTVSVESFIKEAYKNDPQANIDKYSLDVANARLLQEKGANAPSLDLNGGYQLLQENFTSAGFDAGVDLNIPDAGLTIRTGVDGSYKQIPEMAPRVNFQVLYNIFGFLKNRAGVVGAEYDVKIETLKRYESDEVRILALHQKYYEWVALAEKVRIAKETYISASNFVAIMEGKLKLGVVTPIDVSQGKAKQMEFQNDLLVAEALCKAKSIEIQGLMTGKPVVNITRNSLQPMYDLTSLPDTSASISSIDITTTHTWEMLQLLKSKWKAVEQAEARNMLPDINLGISGNKAFGDKSGYSSFNRNNEIGVAFGVTIPLDFSGSRGKVNEARAFSAEAEARMNQYQIQFQQDVVKITGLLSAYQNIIKGYDQTISETEKRLQTEQQLYNMGNKTVNPWQTQADLANYKLERSQYVIALWNAYYYLLDIRDSLKTNTDLSQSLLKSNQDIRLGYNTISDGENGLAAALPVNQAGFPLSALLLMGFMIPFYRKKEEGETALTPEQRRVPFFKKDVSFNVFSSA